MQDFGFDSYTVYYSIFLSLHLCPPLRSRSSTQHSLNTSTTAGPDITGATPPPACWCCSSPCTSAMRSVCPHTVNPCIMPKLHLHHILPEETHICNHTGSNTRSPTLLQVNVFGFGADSRGNWHHYWEQNRYSGEFRKTGVHDADYEAQIIQRLAKAGKITVFPGK